MLLTLNFSSSGRYDRIIIDGDIFGGLADLHMGGAIDIICAGVRADNFFAVRARGRTYAAKNFDDVGRGRPDD